ncbi:DSCAM [Mytilus coruscus]|uniref:DSCAM n=1 Tax=Mytilus coruscus TaxID=42192 RepID=A0A6J7ZVG8_MYTCO|nr:DSCAM [Mytilus coruscus]
MSAIEYICEVTRFFFKYISDLNRSEILFVSHSANFTINCPFQSVNNSTVLWSGPPDLTTYSDKSTVNSEVKGVGISGDSANGEYNLIIYSFKESNEGSYQCSAVIGGMPFMKKFNVMLQISEETNSFNEHHPSESVTEGTNVSFECTAMSIPSPSLFRLIGPVGNVLTTEDTLNDTMMLNFIITNIRKNEIGNYTCTAENDIANGTSTICLTILYYPEVPYLKRVLPGTKSVIIDWSGGHNGGFTQTFVVEYKLESQEHWFYQTNVSETNTTNYSTVICDLLPNEPYNIRMYAVNRMNRSQFTNVFKVTTGGNRKRRYIDSENRNSGQEEENDSFNNIDDINENGPPTLHVVAAVPVLYSNSSSEEALGADIFACRALTSQQKSIEKQAMKEEFSELNYIELELDPIAQGRTFCIHGKDNRTEYSEINFRIIGDPLKWSDSDDDSDTDRL